MSKYPYAILMQYANPIFGHCMHIVFAYTTHPAGSQGTFSPLIIKAHGARDRGPS